MTLEAGTKLGPYEILAPLGAGGMGEVYSARDARLEREVAVKVLPSEFAQEPQRLARFEREAKAVASLSHPNILAIHDFGSANGITYAVTELLAGATLRELLAEGGVPQRKALDYVRQAANGLAAAHDRGVVHRDLKPENLFVTREGRVKILDFGLAKQALPVDSDAPTIAASAEVGTSPGVLLGTVGYMAPEQVRGQPADHRADIFSLGTVLYELLTGHRAFEADSAIETMNAILNQDPPSLSESIQAADPSLERLLRHCLEKNPEERFQSASDLAFALDSISHTSYSGVRPAAGSLPPRRRRIPLAATAGIALLGVVAGLVAGLLLFRQGPPPAIQTQQLTFRRGAVLTARFAPDGQSVVYAASWEGAPLQIYSAGIGTPGSRSLELGEADLLAVSPRGELLLSLGRRYTAGWETSGTLARASLAGGAPRPILEQVHEADWGPDGDSIAVAREVEGRFQLEYPIGEVLYRSDGWISDLRVSPRGDRLAFVDHPVRGDNIGTLAIVDREGNLTATQTPAGWGLVWEGSGDKVLTAWAGSVFITDLGGTSRPIWNGFGNIRLLDRASDDTLLVSPSSVRREMVARSPRGGPERNLTWFDWAVPRDISRDGTTVLFEEGNQSDSECYWTFLRGTDGSAPVRLENGLAMAISPDSQWIFSLARPFRDASPFLMPTGTGVRQELDFGGIRPQPLGYWTPDGRSLVLAGADESSAYRLYVKDLEGGQVRPVTPPGVRFSYDAQAVSPDGKWIAFAATDGGLFRYPLAGGDGEPILGAQPGDVPARWDDSGDAIYVYQSGGLPTRVERLVLATGERQPWLELAPSDRAGVFNVDIVLITPDGKSYVYSYRRLLGQLELMRGLAF